MSRKPNSEFTTESVKHLAFDNVETRVLEIAMRAYTGQAVTPDDASFMAQVPGTIIDLWSKFRLARTAFETAEMLAAMRANVPAPVVTPVETPATNGASANGAVPAEKPATKA